MLSGFDNDRLPAKIFYSCETTRFVIADQTKLSDILRGKAEPWFTLQVGAGNVFESRPTKILKQSPATVEVSTEDGVTIQLDLDAEAARKLYSDGSQFIYCGGLEEGNEGLGWMPVN